MPDRLVWYVGNRNPSITENITVDGAAYDLTAASGVKFMSRAVGASTTTIDAAATIVSAAAGTVRYDWAANDVDTAGEFIGWWRVTVSSKTQDVGEFVYEVRDHSQASRVYVELEQAKATMDLSGYSHADGDIIRALGAASRSIDDLCNRRFYLDTDATSVRYYTATSRDCLEIDDLVALTTLATDISGDGVYETTWSASDYRLEPVNAPSDDWPYDRIDRKPFGAYQFPTGIANGVKVTGQFGWEAIPAGVQTATLILAGRYIKRPREAPFGVIGVESLVRLSRTDPDLYNLLRPYAKTTPIL